MPRIMPAIFGIKGLALTSEEIAFIKQENPLGFILFNRNCRHPDQIRDLIHGLRSCVKHDRVPILIDQEGGRVTRLPFDHYPCPPAARTFSNRYLTHGEDDAIDHASRNYTKVAQSLENLGINVNCVPCMDAVYPMTDGIIGDRSFFPKDIQECVDLGLNPCTIATNLSMTALSAHYQNGVLPVMKHLPGHGVACQDSHEELPHTDISVEILRKTDFSIFQQACCFLDEENIPHPLGMTAHIVYEAIDPDHPATQSRRVIQDIIRHEIGFKGFLISDCLTMKALTGPYGERAKRSLDAGCDAVIHCNGKIDEMHEIAEALREYSLTEKAFMRLDAAWDLMEFYQARNDQGEEIPA